MSRAALLLLLLLAACDGGSASDPDPVVTPTPIDAATAGTVRGKVVLKGTPPANPKLPIGGNPECNALHSDKPVNEAVLSNGGRLQNVFVYVKSGLEKNAFAWPKEPVKIVNRKCVYVPRVAGAQVHQPVRFENDDPTDHNIHGFPAAGPFNFTLRGKDTWDERKFRTPEVMIRVKCDLHPWMIGYLGVIPHPFFAVTGADGSYEFKGLPPGEYEIEAWHEKFGSQVQSVKIDAKGTATLSFTFKEK